MEAPAARPASAATLEDPPVSRRVWRGGSLAVRAVWAILLAPPFLVAAWVGGLVFFAATLLLTALAGWEFGRFALPARPAARGIVVVIALAAVALRYVAPAEGTAVPALATLAVLTALTVGLTAKDPGEGVRTASLVLLGALYAGLFSFLVALRELPREIAGPEHGGFTLVASALAVVWATDTGAYFAGRAWGRRRLMPGVSPGKTVVGAWGGAALAAVVGAALFAWAPAPLPPLGAAAGAGLGVAGSLLAQTGDLAESLLKRAFGVKDSSGLIPGHGGVLDRFDSLLFTAPAAYYFFRAALS